MGTLTPAALMAVMPKLSECEVSLIIELGITMYLEYAAFRIDPIIMAFYRAKIFINMDGKLCSREEIDYLALCN